jgi:hypothetical protein
MTLGEFIPLVLTSCQTLSYVTTTGSPICCNLLLPQRKLLIGKALPTKILGVLSLPSQAGRFVGLRYVTGLSICEALPRLLGGTNADQ